MARAVPSKLRQTRVAGLGEANDRPKKTEATWIVDQKRPYNQKLSTSQLVRTLECVQVKEKRE
jgi:hypothetical protein